MCLHKQRQTWEIPGGHIEKSETPREAAKRELQEETGAKEFTLLPVSKYAFKKEGKKIFGILYESNITKIGDLPDFEIKKVSFFEKLPDNLTYPEIYKELLKRY